MFPLLPISPDVAPALTKSKKKLLDGLLDTLDLGFYSFLRKTSTPLVASSEAEERWHRCFEYNLRRFLLPELRGTDEAHILVRKYIFNRTNGNPIERKDLTLDTIDLGTRPNPEVFCGSKFVARPPIFLQYGDIDGSENNHKFTTSVNEQNDTANEGFSVLISYGPKYDDNGSEIKKNIEKAKAVTKFFDIILMNSTASRCYEEVKMKGLA